MRLTRQEAAELAERGRGSTMTQGARVSPPLPPRSTSRPGASTRAAPARARRESEILREVLLAVRAVGAIAWRQNTGGMYDRRGRFVRFSPPGCPDILGVVPVPRLGWSPYPAVRWGRLGVFLAIEVKRPGRQPTLEQRMFLDSIAAMGGLAIVAHTAEEAVKPVLALMGREEA